MHELSLTLTAVPENMSSCRTYIKSYCHELGLSKDLTRDILTTTGEAIKNIIEYAYESDPCPGPIHLSGTIIDNALLAFEIKDEGAWIEDKDGSGTHLMESLSTNFIRRRGTVQRGTIVTLIFDTSVSSTNLLQKVN